jgi:hypothetical protein
MDMDIIRFLLRWGLEDRQELEEVFRRDLDLITHQTDF